MPLHGQGQVARIHPMTVVGNGDLCFSAACNANGNRIGAGVERILDQFLDDGRWALDDFPSSNSIDRSLRQPADRH